MSTVCFRIQSRCLALSILPRYCTFTYLYFLCLNYNINKTLNLLARGKAVEVDRLVAYAGYLDDQDERDEHAYSAFSCLATLLLLLHAHQPRGGVGYGSVKLLSRPLLLRPIGNWQAAVKHTIN